MIAQKLARFAGRAGRSAPGAGIAAAGPVSPLPAGRSSGARGRALIWASSAPQSDLVAVRAGEDREPSEVSGQVGGRDQPLAAQLLGPVQVGVQVIDPHVDLDALLPRLVPPAHTPAAGPPPGPGGGHDVPPHRRVRRYPP